MGTIMKARKKEKDSPQSAPDEQKLYLENTMLQQCFSDVDFRLLVEQPSGLEYNEWLASHTLAFFEHINLIYGTISEFCTMSGCPDMTGPCSRQYLWFDERGKKCKVAAPHYIDYVMTFTQKTINDETIFPTKYANDFPTSIESIVKKIHQLLFHVVAHMYHAHFKELVLLSLHAHLNLVFAHLVLFNERYRLIEEKETDVLHDLAIGLKLLGATDSGDENTSQERGGGSSITTNVAESGDNNCEKTNDGDCSGNVSTNVDTQPALSLYLDGSVEVQ